MEGFEILVLDPDRIRRRSCRIKLIGGDNGDVYWFADDETHIVQVLALKFRNAGHDVLEASDGEEALQLAREYTPDVIVTDVQMPFMNGIELAAGALLADSRLCNPARSGAYCTWMVDG